MKTQEILNSISSNGGYCNLNRWNKKEVAQWVHANYICSWYVAHKVAEYIY